MKLADDSDFGGPLTAAVWIAILVIPLCMFGLVFGGELADRATKVLLADFGLLGSFVALKTAGIVRGQQRESKGDSVGGKDA